ncbi:DUF4097 family beta strand repeat-containing protein [Staphylococcus kloosii]|uniref:DUF4097 domain-containing protein n=1 Tax=Staphylococcus kloosii TaxID=29384 RepID=A0A921GYS9_9STAP|nr:DUF4097 family beta strand repeat-containing protein [Staphylococcus kloosii]GEP81984.1 hypothetical protein SKL01_11620 [Staphylococcus kloosii]SUM50292.1 exported protein [Staphylococcus kloosii]HJF66963.1 DUF4097 domain-containing protein [Staphylococcus kloosii]
MKKLLWILFALGTLMFVVFGILTIIKGKEIAHTHPSKVTNNEDFNENIDHLNINGSNANVKIKQGDKFNVKSIGPNSKYKSNAKVNNKSLNINMNQPKAIVNLNPFQRNYTQLEVTVPKSLKSIKISGESGNIDVDGINTQSSKFKADSGQVKLKNSKLGSLNINVDTGKLVTQHSKFQHAKIKADTGLVRMKNVPADKPIDIDVDTAYVHLSFDQAPKNSLFDVNQQEGKPDINIPSLKNKKIGNGKNIIKIRTDVGHVKID